MSMTTRRSASALVLSDVVSLKSLVLQASSFGFVGLVAGIIDYSAMVALRELLDVPAVSAAAVGYLVGSIVSYLFNRRLTFRSDRLHREAVWRFMVVNVIGFGLTALSMALLVNRIGVNYLLARLLTIAVVFGVNFLSHRFWTFRASRG